MVALASGGLDSLVLVHELLADGHRVRMLSFDYGQRHARELDFARQAAAALGLAHDFVDLRSVGALLVGNALTDPAAPVPEGHYADASMRATVVPNRNAIMLDVAVAVAVAAGCGAVAFGAHGGDRAVYPDCRPGFLAAFAVSAQLANDGFLPAGFRVLAPFLRTDKAGIVAIGAALGVPFDRTWSCYQGGELHCGKCGACTERRESFAAAGVPDPTIYETESS
jgi:7-cyano-7-deazaguanine synthase